MSTYAPGHRLRHAAVAIVLVTGACSSQPANVEVADDRGIDAVPSTTATEPPTTTTEPIVTTTTASPTSLEPVRTTSSTSPTTTTTAPDEYAEYDIEVISDFAVGSAELVRLTPIDAPDVECSQGLLAVQFEGEIIHTYDELGTVGGLRPFYGPRAQLAIVDSCEEWTTRILFSDFGVPPADNVPLLFSAVPPEEVFFLHEFGWFGLSGMFTAEASFYGGTGEGWNDTVVFTTHDGYMRVASDVIGWREPILAAGVDYVGPSGWSVPVFRPDATSIGMSDLDNGSSLLITVHEGPVDPPTAAVGETNGEPYVLEVATWESLDSDRARSRKVGTARTLEYIFGSDAGTRTIRQIEIDDRTVEVELFVSADIGAPTADIPWAAMDAVRVYETVG